LNSEGFSFQCSVSREARQSLQRKSRVKSIEKRTKAVRASDPERLTLRAVSEERKFGKNVSNGFDVAFASFSGAGRGLEAVFAPRTGASLAATSGWEGQLLWEGEGGDGNGREWKMGKGGREHEERTNRKRRPPAIDVVRPQPAQ
jgi:hypothetical protein